MAPFHQWVIDEGSAGMRLDIHLTRHFSDLQEKLGPSRAVIQRLIAEGQVTVNGHQARSSFRLKPNDCVRVKICPPRSLSIEPQALPLEVLYQDEDCLVINKPAGMVVHPGAGNNQGTVVNALLHYCSELKDVGGAGRPGIVHRLDKETSGAMIVAKNMFAFQELARQFRERVVHKEYLALAWGKLEPLTGIIDRPIGRHRSDRKRMSSVHALSRTRAAFTEWRVEKYFSIRDDMRPLGWFSLLRLKPRTGRTHQIRVHLADLGHPIVGDKVYHRQEKARMAKNDLLTLIECFPRQALHAARLRIQRVRTGEPLEFNAPLPADMQELLRRLEMGNLK
jgi:23S rRNA pseudouridine1911/1915/1917 synthase